MAVKKKIALGKTLKGDFTLGDGCAETCKKKIPTFPAGEGRG
jgi:hypothetical protein